jgi:hypothetical protein
MSFAYAIAKDRTLRGKRYGAGSHAKALSRPRCYRWLDGSTEPRRRFVTRYKSFYEARQPHMKASRSRGGPLG